MARTTVEAFFETARRLSTRTAWQHRGRAISWAGAANQVRRAAAALRALGLAPGERVALLGPNRPEWVAADLAILAAGLVPVPIYPTLTAEQIAWIARHAGVRAAFVGEAAAREKLAGAEVDHFIALDAGAGDLPGWEAFLARGEAGAGEVDGWVQALEPRALATLIYTSGTTGPPKGVMLSHDNLLFAAELGKAIAAVTERDVGLSYLPLSHIAEQMITVHGPTASGATMVFCDRLEDLQATLLATRPTIFFAVPRVWEKFQTSIEQQVAAAPPARQKLFAWARRSKGLFAKLLVHGKLRRRLGLDRARILATGAAVMPRGTLEFFDSLGMPILDMYGMTESTAAAAANTPGARRAGSVGRALPDTGIRLAPDGEVLIRGRHVFLGYFGDEAATKEALDPEGFLHTGDVGSLDLDGYLHITDRKKEILVTSGGKNVSPQNLEGELNRIPGVASAVVVGDGRKHLAALFTLAPEALRGRPPDDPDLQRELQAHVDAVNARLASFETIKKWRVLPAPFSIEGGELTPTFKLKRRVIEQKYAREIDALFAESPVRAVGGR